MRTESTDENPPAGEKKWITCFDELQILSEMLVSTAISNSEFVLLNESDSVLEIKESHGIEDFIFLSSDSKDAYNKKFQSMLIEYQDKKIQHSHYYGDMYFSRIQDRLDIPLTALLGCDSKKLQDIIHAIANNPSTIENSFGICFVSHKKMIDGLMDIYSLPRPQVELILSGLTITPNHAKKRLIWKPKQQERSTLRPLLEMPHKTGKHFVWSKEMTEESIAFLFHDFGFQYIPEEWASKEMLDGISKLSHDIGKDFEDYCMKQLQLKGFSTKLNYDSAAGEIDLLAYDARANQLLVIECKRVKAGTESLYFHDDMNKFIHDEDSFVNKLDKKVTWIRENRKTIQNIPELNITDENFLISEMILTAYFHYPSVVFKKYPIISMPLFISRLRDIKTK